MNAPSRFESLEKQVVDALRRAPGAEPSNDLDARIRARAHAAVRPAKRPQPWFSMAAGILVLLGTGLALQISRQVEQVPSALKPPASVIAEHAVVATDALQPDAEHAAEQMASAASARAGQDGRALAEERKQASSETSELAARQLPIQPKSLNKFEAPGLADAPAADSVDDDLGAAMPFPTESAAAPEPMAAPELARPAPPAEPAVPSALPAAPAVLAAPSKPGPRAEQDAAVLRDDFSSVDGQVAPASGASAARLRAATPARAKVAPETSLDADADGTHLQGSDPFNDGLAQIRAALAKGDPNLAHDLLLELRQAHPDRELPDDLREWADSLQ